MTHTQSISAALNISERQVEATLQLFAEGCTIPFIARYRKERTGELDEVQIGQIQQRKEQLDELDKRRTAILSSIEEQGFLTNELKALIEKTLSLTELEDIYLPYKPKRKTKATIAKAKGLEPLAKIIMKQDSIDVNHSAAKFVNDEKEVKSIEEALQGARDIIAEWVNESTASRTRIRTLFQREAIISSKVSKSKEVEAEKYRNYFNWSEPLYKAPSHRILALFRAENEGMLKLNIAPSEEKAIDCLNRIFIRSNNSCTEHIEIAVHDGYKRLLAPSIENEIRAEFKQKADIEAIQVFATNLRQLLLMPPLGQKRVLGIDPGFRTGCKLVCLDEQGKLLHNETIYPHPPQEEKAKASSKISQLVDSYKIDAISIGNGTASRETENLVKKIRFNRDIKVFVVSEAGASIYSASSVARQEFPDYDVTVRGSVSIGRRLMDPLAELVKIEPKSIGVGQYQHDVDQTMLQKSLDGVVESCVNMVGVEVNTASKQLLTYVSGLGPVLAQNIINHRNENGPFKSRSELKKVARLGSKAFEQAAGFLRIRGAKNPLDNSAVHPERYDLVSKMAKDLNVNTSDLIENKDILKTIDPKKYVNEEIGLPTLKDIIEELAKPGRDPREKIEIFEFDQNIHKIDDLIPGMILPGIVTNITAFGCFVDIGIKENGLVHISQICKTYISNPNEVIQINQHVKVKVMEVDMERKRIALSIKEAE